MQNHYHYDAFGVILESEENIPNRITYTGQQYDSITQQYYLRARYYNPLIGRFTQEDVYRGDGLNLYAYCSNNPVIYYDPSGYGSVNKESAFADSNISKRTGGAVETFVDMMDSAEAASYERYWKQGAGLIDKVKENGEFVYKIMDRKNVNTRQRLYTVPGERSIKDIKINSKTGETYIRETIFDKYGRRIGNNDFTDHGRPDIPSHTNPHYHENPYRNPDQHGPGIPGLHPQTQSKR